MEKTNNSNRNRAENSIADSGKWRLGTILADKPVNTGRQLAVDLGKASMVLCLPFIHCIIECTSEEGLCSGIPYLFDTIIGGPMSAPMYMFCMGIGVVYSRAAAPRIFKRARSVAAIFYLLNICRFLIPYLIGYAVSGDVEQFLDPLVYRVLGNDILIFASMSLMTLALFMQLGLSDRQILGIPAAMSVIGTLLNGTDTGNQLGNIFLGYLLGTEDATGLLISDFPLFNWMIVPAAGYVFGRMLIRAKDVDRFYGRFSLPALAVALIYLPIGIHQEWGMFGEGQNCYYHINSWDVFISLCMTVAMLGIWHLVSRYIPEGGMRFFTEVSININAFYCIHWVFVRTITNVVIYIRTGTQELPLGTTMMLAASIMVISVIMAHYWRRWKIYHRGNRPVY